MKILDANRRRGGSRFVQYIFKALQRVSERPAAGVRAAGLHLFIYEYTFLNLFTSLLSTLLFMFNLFHLRLLRLIIYSSLFRVTNVTF